MTQHEDPSIELTAPGVVRLRTLMANLFFVTTPGTADAPWVLIDTGLPGYRSTIEETAWVLFGDRPPAAILLTHGHVDHVGSLRSLLRTWPVPVYAHVLEFPYLTGQSPYPPADVAGGGGLLARLSFLYPRGPIDVGPSLLALPPDGVVPGLPGWQWHHTPGHAPGHVSFFRAHDRVLIAGDALVTTRQESATSVLLQRAELRPPPAYFTIDWDAARESVRRLAALDPHILSTGHGPTIAGELLDRQLGALVDRADHLMPPRGRDIDQPAAPARAPVAAPVRAGRARHLALPLAAGAVLVAAGWYWSGHRRRRGQVARGT